MFSSLKNPSFTRGKGSVPLSLAQNEKEGNSQRRDHAEDEHTDPELPGLDIGPLDQDNRRPARSQDEVKHRDIENAVILQ